MALLIKICGLKTPETLEVALESGADMVGFVFFGPSPRNVSNRKRRRLQRKSRKRNDGSGNNSSLRISRGLN